MKLLMWTVSIVWLLTSPITLLALAAMALAVWYRQGKDDNK